jgi:NADH dehydrogenase
MNVRIVAITGATGFVGQEVTRHLLEKGYIVQALVRSEASASKLTPHQNLKLTIGDPCDASDVAKVLAGADALVHLVGIRRHEIKRTGKTYEDIDIGSAVASAYAMKHTGLKRILFLSAAAIGKSFYVRCKAKAEAVIMSANLDWTIWRPSFIVGPGQQWPVVLAPILGLLSLFPGHTGDVARRGSNISRKALAATFYKALEDDSTVGEVLDVPEIRAFVNS